MNLSLGDDIFKRVRRLTEGPLPEDLWAGADRLSDELDMTIAPLITEPDYYREFSLVICVEICGQDTLHRLHPQGFQHCVPGNQFCTIRVLGGPLPNDRIYLGPWGPGHEVGHGLGYIYGGDANLPDVDHLCEGMEQQGLWERAYTAGGAVDAVVRPMLRDPGYHEKKLLSLVVHLCGPARLPQVAADLAQGIGRPELTPYYLPLLGGPLPNGRLYLSQGALSQQLVRWVCKVANPCVGL